MQGCESPAAAKACEKCPFHQHCYRREQSRTLRRTRAHAFTLRPLKSRQSTALGVYFLPVRIEGAQRHGWESQPVGVKVEVEVDRVAEVLPVEDPKLPVH